MVMFGNSLWNSLAASLKKASRSWLYVVHVSVTAPPSLSESLPPQAANPAPAIAATSANRTRDFLDTPSPNSCLRGRRRAGARGVQFQETTLSKAFLGRYREAKGLSTATVGGTLRWADRTSS